MGTSTNGQPPGVARTLDTDRLILRSRPTPLFFRRAPQSSARDGLNDRSFPLLGGNSASLADSNEPTKSRASVAPAGDTTVRDLVSRPGLVLGIIQS